MSENPFLVNRIVPEGQSSGRIYQVTVDSVSPTRVVGSDEFGNPVEETVCALAKSELFVDLDGNICNVPLRTGRVPSEEPEATRYEAIIYRDLILQGQIPLRCCPHTREFRTIRAPLVTPPKGEQECDGAMMTDGRMKTDQYGNPVPCEHMEKLIEKRRAAAKKKFESSQTQLDKVDIKAAERMMHAFAAGFNQSQPQRAEAATRNNLIDGRGEKEKR